MLVPAIDQVFSTV